jgi:pimeloyl-ACP methyl ester carboxylesterase
MGHTPFVIASLALMMAQAPGGLPRRGGALENLPGVETVYGSVTVPGGTRLRTIVTRPQGASGRLPGLYFVQWLSCSTVEAGESRRDGWSRMIRRIVQESGFAVGRTEKAGVGDSEGACAALDYDTELAHHRHAFDRFRQSPWVDASRVVVFGGSMGANMAPLIARDRKVAGVMVWGGGARTWFERQLAFSRHAMELAGENLDRLSARMADHSLFYAEYLLAGKTPARIRADDPALGAVWSDIIGTEGDLQYGRPAAFHQQAQNQDWAAAWAAIAAPVLVIYGEYDWFEDAGAAATIVRIVNRQAPGRAALTIVPRMDHHFSQYQTAEAAFREQGGTVNEAPAVDEMLAWLKRIRSGS